MKGCVKNRHFICLFVSSYQVTDICRPSQARVVPGIAMQGTGTSSSTIIMPSKATIASLDSKQVCWNGRQLRFDFSWNSAVASDKNDFVASKQGCSYLVLK